jgi:hypothetical protein
LPLRRIITICKEGQREAGEAEGFRMRGKVEMAVKGKGKGKKAYIKAYIAPLLFAGAAGCVIYLLSKTHQKKAGPQFDEAQEAGAWTKGLLLTPPVTPRPGARGLYEDVELPVEKAIPIMPAQKGIDMIAY